MPNGPEIGPRPEKEIEEKEEIREELWRQIELQIETLANLYQTLEKNPDLKREEIEKIAFGEDLSKKEKFSQDFLEKFQRGVSNFLLRRKAIEEVKSKIGEKPEKLVEGLYKFKPEDKVDLIKGAFCLHLVLSEKDFKKIEKSAETAGFYEEGTIFSFIKKGAEESGLKHEEIHAFYDLIFPMSFRRFFNRGERIIEALKLEVPFPILNYRVELLGEAFLRASQHEILAKSQTVSLSPEEKAISLIFRRRLISEKPLDFYKNLEGEIKNLSKYLPKEDQKKIEENLQKYWRIFEKGKKYWEEFLDILEKAGQSEKALAALTIIPLDKYYRLENLAQRWLKKDYYLYKLSVRLDLETLYEIFEKKIFYPMEKIGEDMRIIAESLEFKNFEDYQVFLKDFQERIKGTSYSLKDFELLFDQSLYNLIYDLFWEAEKKEIFKKWINF